MPLGDFRSITARLGLLNIDTKLDLTEQGV